MKFIASHEAAIERACYRYEPGEGILFHSDRGCQYASTAFRQMLERKGFISSMSRKGNCWDNAVAESFFGSLKKERIKKHIYKDRDLANEDIADYIDAFYNRTRRHSHLGGVSPDEFEVAARRRRDRVH